MSDGEKYKHRPVLHGAVRFLFVLGLLVFGSWQAMVHPETPLAPEWNPVQPLVVTDPETPITQWKLGRALSDEQKCLVALGTGAQAESKPDFIENAQCGIAPQVALSGIAGVDLKPVNTRCQTALRLAMWTEHDLKPAAQEIFDQDLARVEHFSSYSCRAMRTTSGDTGRMSAHATADAIDISGFVLADGTTIRLLRDWDEAGDKARFLRRANQSACDWFRLTLGPQYNRLHADHFHLQNTGFGLCR